MSVSVFVCSCLASSWSHPLLFSRFLSTFPAAQCLTRLKWAKSALGSVQEAQRPFELHCVITAGAVLMAVYPHGCSYSREIGVNGMILQICESARWLSDSQFQQPLQHIYTKRHILRYIFDRNMCAVRTTNSQIHM